MSDQFETDPLDLLRHWRSRLAAASALVRAALRESPDSPVRSIEKKLTIAAAQVELVQHQIEVSLRAIEGDDD